MTSVPPRVPINVDLFVEPLHEKYKCPICLDLLNCPTQCPQGHVFCKDCISRVTRSISGICKCPMDREEFGKHKLQPNLFVQNCIDDLQIRCANSTIILNGERQEDCCSWSGPLFRYQKHETDECQYTLVSCRYEDCSAFVQRRHLSSHLSSCFLRPTSCQYCDIGVKIRDIVEHERNCEYAPAECPHQCGATAVIVKSHLLECPLEFMDCPLFTLGRCRVCTETPSVPSPGTRGKVRRNALLSHTCGFSDSVNPLSNAQLQQGMTHLAQTTVDLCQVINTMQSTLSAIQRSMSSSGSSSSGNNNSGNNFSYTPSADAASEYSVRSPSSVPSWRLSNRLSALRAAATAAAGSASASTSTSGAAAAGPTLSVGVRFATPSEEEDVAEVRQANRRRRLNDGSAFSEYPLPTATTSSSTSSSTATSSLYAGAVRSALRGDNNDDDSLFGLGSILQSREQTSQNATTATSALSGGAAVAGASVRITTPSSAVPFTFPASTSAATAGAATSSSASNGFSWQDSLMFSESERQLLRRMMSRAGTEGLARRFREFLLHRRRQGQPRYQGDWSRVRADDPLFSEFRDFLAASRGGGSGGGGSSSSNLGGFTTPRGNVTASGSNGSGGGGGSGYAGPFRYNVSSDDNLDDLMTAFEYPVSASPAGYSRSDQQIMDHIAAAAGNRRINSGTSSGSNNSGAISGLFGGSTSTGEAMSVSPPGRSPLRTAFTLLRNNASPQGGVGAGSGGGGSSSVGSGAVNIAAAAAAPVSDIESRVPTPIPSFWDSPLWNAVSDAAHVESINLTNDNDDGEDEDSDSDGTEIDIT